MPKVCYILPSMHGMMFNDSVILPLVQVQQPFMFFTWHVTLSPSLKPFPNSSMHEPLQSGPDNECIRLLKYNMWMLFSIISQNVQLRWNSQIPATQSPLSV